MNSCLVSIEHIDDGSVVLTAPGGLSASVGPEAVLAALAAQPAELEKVRRDAALGVILAALSSILGGFLDPAEVRLMIDWATGKILKVSIGS